MVAQKANIFSPFKSPIFRRAVNIELFVTLTQNMERKESVPSYEEAVPELQSQHSQL